MFVYILKCENSKYYVGKTNNVEKRLEDHKNGDVYWTKINKIIKVEEVVSNVDDFDEDKYVKIYMKKYGIENVRGGSYSQCKIPKNKLSVLKMELNTSDDKCYKCGRKGHYINQCKTKTSKYYTTSTKILSYF